jgi:hypothetical protein
MQSAATPFIGEAGLCIGYQGMAHRERRGSQEMVLIIETPLRSQPEVGLVDECGRLHSHPGRT